MIRMRGLVPSKKLIGHRYLAGNFAPVQRQRSLDPCRYYGQIPRELIGGQYVRNGGNPFVNEDVDRDAHWFDGDGMLSGVYFRPIKNKDCVHVQPEYSNQYILTDVFQAASEAKQNLRLPLLPSVTTLTDPMSSLVTILKAILRTMFYVLRSFLRQTSTPIRRISVANTSIVHHDGRVLVTCESGPPMRVFLPELKTVGWFNAWLAEGESVSQKSATTERRFGGNGLLGFFKEWTTGHVCWNHRKLQTAVDIKLTIK
jgi:carotenoid cleavage dioxygenase-like enzyme